MTTAMSLGLLFIAKMADNALSTVKTIMIQRNRSLLAGVAITLSSFLYFWITRKERYKVPRKVQAVIPIRRIWPDGIFQVGSKFTKMYRFTDINYLVASREDTQIWWSRLEWTSAGWM